MSKPELEFHAPTGEWTSEGIDGLWERVLSLDPDTGDHTRLLRWDPGTDTSERGSVAHDFWEEAYVLEGSFTDLRLDETFTAGMYACRPPGMLHGPWRSDDGAVLLEFRYGFERGASPVDGDAVDSE